MNHFTAYSIGFRRGLKRNTLYEWGGDEKYKLSFQKGNVDGINHEEVES